MAARPSLRSRTPACPAADGEARTDLRNRTLGPPAAGAGSVDVGNGDEREIGRRRAGRDDRMPPPAGFTHREVLTEVSAAALTTSEGGFGDEAADEQQIAGFDSAARHGTESEPPLQAKDGVDRTTQTCPVPYDPHSVPHDPLEGLERRIRGRLVDRQGHCRVPDQRSLRGWWRIVPQDGVSGSCAEDQPLEKRVARQA